MRKSWVFVLLILLSTMVNCVQSKSYRRLDASQALKDPKPSTIGFTNTKDSSKFTVNVTLPDIPAADYHVSGFVYDDQFQCWPIDFKSPDRLVFSSSINVAPGEYYVLIRVHDGFTQIARIGNDIDSYSAGSTPVVVELKLSESNLEAITSPYIENPELMKDFIKESANFWTNAIDSKNGGFHTFVERDGTPVTGKHKSFVVQSRHGYGFSRAFMVSGDKSYLEYGRHALDFLYQNGWDTTYGGWFFAADENGRTSRKGMDSGKWTYAQHYNTLGIAAMYEAARNSEDYQWLMKSTESLNKNLWDNTYPGYYSAADFDWSNPRGKGFTPTVDGVTTNALFTYLITGEPEHRNRLIDLGENMYEHLVVAMDNPVVKRGFPEAFHTDWKLNTKSTTSSTGHQLKTSWCLARLHLIEPDMRYKQGAQKLILDAWYNGLYDHFYMGPFTGYNWKTGNMNAFSKNYWMLEQAVTAGLINFHIAKDSQKKRVFIDMARETLMFYMEYLVDHEYGETFSDLNYFGDVTNDRKSDMHKSGYHNIETAFMVYVYGNLFYKRKPVSLFYYFPPKENSRTVKLTPLACDEEKLEITDVRIENEPYDNINGTSREITLPGGVGGVFKVTFNLKD